MGFDWATDNYLADALDAAEKRADKYEAYLAEQEAGRSNIMHTALTSLTSAGTAGGMAYLAQTAFRKDGKAGMLQLGPIGLDLFVGLAGKAAALFSSKLKIPHNATPYIDAVAQGALDHAAVMFGMHKGAEHAGAKPTTYANVQGSRVAGALGGSQHPTPAPAHASHSPEQYMTPQQAQVWKTYA